MLLITALLNSSQLNGQQSPYNNYLHFNVSYAFFGTGDQGGSTLGLNYVHMLSKRFGAQFSYKVAYADDPDFSTQFTNQQLTNVVLQGDAGHAVSISNYKMVNIGPVFKLTDTDKNQLLVSAGFNYKKAKYNYIGNLRSLNNNTEVSIDRFVFTSENEIGGFVQLQYYYFIKDNFSIGFHAGTQPSSNIVHDFGVTLGSRF